MTRHAAAVTILGLVISSCSTQCAVHPRGNDTRDTTKHKEIRNVHAGHRHYTDDEIEEAFPAGLSPSAAPEFKLKYHDHVSYYRTDRTRLASGSDSSAWKRFDTLFHRMIRSIYWDGEPGIMPLTFQAKDTEEYKEIVAEGDTYLPFIFDRMTNWSEPLLVQLAGDITGVDIRETGEFYPPTTTRATEMWLEWRAHWAPLRKESP